MSKIQYETIFGSDLPSKSLSNTYNRIDNHNSDCDGLSIHIDEEDDLSFKEQCKWLRQRFFTKEKLKRRLPIANWLPNYSVFDLKGDIIAGISVAFTIVPQALALAVLAGLPAQYGLYTSFVGCFVYAMLGSCKDVAVGPTSIMAIIIVPYVLKGGIAYSILLAFFAGCIQFLFGIFNLGFLVDFISFPVVSSFSSAAAITIAASQFKGLFGLHYTASRFPETIYKLLYNFKNVNIYDTLMGFICMAFLIPIHLAKDYKFMKRSAYDNIMIVRLKNFLWTFLVTGRNAIAVIVCAIIAKVYYSSEVKMFTLTGDIRTGLPDFEWPPFTMNSNQTQEEVTHIIGELGPGIIVVALLGLMEVVAVAKAFTTKKLDATQEMIALGMCNILGSFFGAFAATGSFSRSAVNHNSGVRTPLGGVITGGLVLLSLGTLAPYFKYIPQTALATIIITAVIFVIRLSDAKLIWQTNKIDILPYVSTFTVCLMFGLEYGIVTGIATSIMILLYQMARPKVFIVKRRSPDGFRFLYVKPDRSVFFPSIEYMKVKIGQKLAEIESNEECDRVAVVLDGEHMYRADSTFALGIKKMITSLRIEGVLTILYNLRKSVFNAIYGLSIPPNHFHHCLTKDDVFAVIKSHNKANHHKRSHSMVENMFTRSTTSLQHWATNSF